MPEVETIKRGLKSFILNQKIQKIEVFCEKSFIGDISKLRNQKIINLRRFGKALILDLDNNNSLMIHLRMTGQLIYDGKERYAAGHPSENFISELPNKQTRVVITFENGTLYFNDQRKFGFVKLIATDEIKNDAFIQKLAKEPWDMSLDEFYEKLKRHQNALIKATILDQSIICGLGNIYADESLFEAKIHPKRKSGSLTKEEAKRLLNAMKHVMEESISSGGSTMATYVKADGTKGDYLEKFAKVFHKEGTPCPRCGKKIQKIKVAGRGTHICENCQKEPEND